jgi:PAS domain S-box-containing protein
MTWVFWLDVTAYSVSAAIAITLTLMALGAGTRRVTLNHSFAFFTLTAAAWAALMVLLRLALWLHRGNPALLGELAALAFILLGPALLLFTTRYVGRRTRQTDLAALVGIAAFALIALPIFNCRLVLDHQLAPNGTTRHPLSLLGEVFAVATSLYIVWSLALFWQERRRTGETYLAASTLFLVLGLVADGILDIYFPALSLATCLSVAILGYAVVSRQLFNPLRAQTVELQREIREQMRIKAALQAQREVEREFSQRLAQLHEVSLKLSLTDSLDDLCRLAIELGHDLVGLDRLGIWFVDQEDAEYMLGTFGIDENGELRDERQRRVFIGPGTIEGELLAAQMPLAHRADGDLYNDRSELVGRGEKALAALWDGEKIVGLLFADNLMTGQPITKRQRDLLVLFAQMVGHLSTLKQAQEALRASEELLRLIFENAFDGISVYEEFPESGERKLVDCNARYAEIAGRSKEELLKIGNTLPFQSTIGDDLNRPEFVSILREMGFYRGLFSWLRPDGKENIVEYAAVPIQVGNRALTVGIDRDITERKQTEAEILHLQHLLQNITDSMPSALITLDLDGRVLTWNPAAQELTGQSSAQVEGQSLWHVCPELDRYRDLFERVLREGRIAYRHKDPLTVEAATVYRDVSVFPLQANDIEGTVMRIDDVTRRVQLEEMMLQSAKMASVGGLAAGVAHEINNPLSAILQSAQVLKLAFDTERPRTRDHLQACGVAPDSLRHYLQERELLEYLDGIRDTGERAAKIVSDLLSFSRKSSSDAASNDLNALVEQTLDLAAADYDLRKKYDFRDIEIVRELAPDLPKVVCDGQQIQQVVLNLVRNAAQAMAHKIEEATRAYQPWLTLRTSLLPGPGPRCVRLEVEDNGPGMPEAVRARLFEPFLTTKDVGKERDWGYGCVGPSW